MPCSSGDRLCRSVKTLNTLESNKRCEVQEVACEDMLEREQQVKPCLADLSGSAQHCPSPVGDV